MMRESEGACPPWRWSRAARGRVRRGACGVVRSGRACVLGGASLLSQPTPLCGAGRASHWSLGLPIPSSPCEKYPTRPPSSIVPYRPYTLATLLFLPARATPRPARPQRTTQRPGAPATQPARPKSPARESWLRGAPHDPRREGPALQRGAGVERCGSGRAVVSPSRWRCSVLPTACACVAMPPLPRRRRLHARLDWATRRCQAVAAAGCVR